MAALEVVFDWRPESFGAVRFKGLTGSERVTSLKQAVNLLQVENPAVTLCRDAEAGAYDRLPDEDYKNVLAFVEGISVLWRYADDEEPAGKSARREMNVVMLLANALEMIGRQAAEARAKAAPEAMETSNGAKP